MPERARELPLPKSSGVPQGCQSTARGLPRYGQRGVVPPPPTRRVSGTTTPKGRGGARTSLVAQPEIQSLTATIALVYTGTMPDDQQPDDDRPPVADRYPLDIPVMTARRWAAQDAFLEAFRFCGNVALSCRSLEISTTTVWSDWMNQDETKSGRELFSERFNRAKMEAIDHIEGELYRRAVKGVQRPVYQGGQEVGTVTEYSDQLLMFLLKALAPGKYRDKFEGANLFGVSGDLNVQNNQVIGAIANMTKEELRRLADRGLKADGRDPKADA